MKKNRNSNHCWFCGKKIDERAVRCRSCARKHEWKNPSTKMLIRHRNFREAGRKISANLPRTEKQKLTSLKNLKIAQNLP